jgi:hypothetical protein
MASAPGSGGAKLFDGLWPTEGRDFIIKCGGHLFEVHRSVLSAAFPVLRVACYGGFKVSEPNSLIPSSLIFHSKLIVANWTFQKKSQQFLLEYCSSSIKIITFPATRRYTRSAS